MGAQLKANSAKLQGAEAYLGKHNDDLKCELAQAAVDVAGIADPTPISDIVGAGMSLYKGDFIGAGLSLISVIPYAGDALGKTAKGARAAKKINDLKKKIEATVASVNLFKKLAQRNAAAAIRAKRKAEAAKQAAKAKLIKGCEPPPNRFGTRLPADDKGTWSGEKGNSLWTPKAGSKPVEYKEGYPDFSPYAQHSVEIEFDLTGNRARDFEAADEAIRKKLGDLNWERPKDMTWHHKEDGATMELVPRDIHSAAQHTGGVSIITDLGY